MPPATEVLSHLQFGERRRIADFILRNIACKNATVPFMLENGTLRCACIEVWQVSLSMSTCPHTSHASTTALMFRAQLSRSVRLRFRLQEACPHISSVC